MTLDSSRGDDRPVIRGWHVLAGMVVFFGIIFAVNGVFLTLALQTHTGVVSEQPYRKGLDYNQRIAAGERQRALGWRSGLTVSPANDQVRLTLADRDRRPITGMTIGGFIGRPATGRHDVAIKLAETLPPGTYAASVRGLAAGNWLVELDVREPKATGTEVVYRLRKRLWLKP